jgi:undecaprenyl-diphosphatase
MDSILLLKAFILGIVEGVTEFLPVSSTGHLIIAGDLLGVSDEKWKVFDIVIQLGAILAVVWEYRARFLAAFAGFASQPRQRRFVLNLCVAFIPAAALGLLLHRQIKMYLFSPTSVALALIAGAAIIFWVESRQGKIVSARIDLVDDMTWRDALKVGIAQCFSLIPGTSRSGATIMGGMLFGLSRRAATEFSFFLAVPVMFAASGYQLYSYRDRLGSDDLAAITVGFGVSFVGALFAVRALIRFVASHDFKSFAWYRIVLGLVVLGYFHLI